MILDFECPKCREDDDIDVKIIGKSFICKCGDCGLEFDLADTEPTLSYVFVDCYDSLDHIEVKTIKKER